MSLFQCEHCGCAENTALSHRGFAWPELYDWTGREDLRGKKLCSACGPTKHSDGTPTWRSGWHGKFDRVFLPMGMFQTNCEGDLAHIKTGDTNFRKFEIAVDAETRRHG